MARYIDADAYAFSGDLVNEPTADVVEVKHGKWIYNTDDFTPKMRCSVCGYNKPIVAGEGIEQEPNDFCNKCGADMRGETDAKL